MLVESTKRAFDFGLKNLCAHETRLRDALTGLVLTVEAIAGGSS